MVIRSYVCHDYWSSAWEAMKPAVIQDDAAHHCPWIRWHQNGNAFYRVCYAGPSFSCIVYYYHHYCCLFSCVCMYIYIYIYIYIYMLQWHRNTQVTHIQTICAYVISDLSDSYVWKRSDVMFILSDPVNS